MATSHVSDVWFGEIEVITRFVGGQIVDAVIKAHLKLSDVKLGLLLNFNVVRMKDGIKPMANHR